jgi:catechol 2,3-dioxygenase-like lactoylglutathione lyase family enzyme
MDPVVGASAFPDNDVPVPPLHHAAIVTADLDRARRFWQDGLGLVEFFDHEFVGDWPTLFHAPSEQLRSVFLGDPAHPDAGIVELVVFDFLADSVVPPAAPAAGFFLLSFNVDVEATLERLRELGFADDVRRIDQPAGHGRTVPMAVLTAPDGVTVELIGPAR